MNTSPEALPPLRPLRMAAVIGFVAALLLLARELEHREQADVGTASEVLSADASATEGVGPVPCVLRVEPAKPSVGELVGWSIELNSAEGWLPSTQVLIGLEPPWYAARAAFPGAPYPPGLLRASAFEAWIGEDALEVKVQEASEDRSYATVDLPQAAPSGTVLSLRWSGVVAPPRPVERFGPLVLIDRGGEGRFERLCGAAGVAVTAGPPRSLQVTTPSEAAPGGAVAVVLGRVDAYGNPSGGLSERLTAAWEQAAGEAKAAGARAVFLEAGDSPSFGRISLPAPTEPGLYRLRVEGEEGQAFGNVVVVQESGERRLVWADLRGHSALSDGWGTPEAYYRHARDVAGLDAAALSDPDWQLGEGAFERGLAAAEAVTAAGRFVAVPSLEYRQFGHEVAYFFRARGLSGVQPVAGDGATTRWAHDDLAEDRAKLEPGPLALFAAHGEDGLRLATHSALDPARGTGFPIGAPHPNWGTFEMYSARGSSECPDCPRTIWSLPGPDSGRYGSAREALASGAVLGFTASSGGEDGRPGTSLWGPHSGGLTGLWVSSLSREGLEEALRNRRHYATSGVRAWLDVRLDGAPMGSVLPPKVGPSVLRFRAMGESPLLWARVVVAGEVVHELSEPRNGTWVEVEVAPLSPPASLYLALQFRDGHLAWSSPFFVREGVGGNAADAGL